MITRIRRFFCAHNWQTITAEIVPQTDWERPKYSCLAPRPFFIVRTRAGFQRRQFYDVQECVYCGKRRRELRWRDPWERVNREAA